MDKKYTPVPQINIPKPVHPVKHKLTREQIKAIKKRLEQAS